MIILSSLLTPEVVVKRYCAVNRGLVLTDCALADAQRNNVIMASKRRCFDIIVTLLLCCVCRDAISYNHMKVWQQYQKIYVQNITNVYSRVKTALLCCEKRPGINWLRPSGRSTHSQFIQDLCSQHNNAVFTMVDNTIRYIYIYTHTMYVQNVINV